MRCTYLFVHNHAYSKTLNTQYAFHISYHHTDTLTRYVGNCFWTPSQPFRLNRGETQFIFTSQSLSQFQTYRNLCLENAFGGNGVEWTRKAEMSRLEALAVDKACYARLYSNSRLKHREPLLALGSHQGGGGVVFISASAVLHCGEVLQNSEYSIVILNIIPSHTHTSWQLSGAQYKSSLLYIWCNGLYIYIFHNTKLFFYKIYDIFFFTWTRVNKHPTKRKNNNKTEQMREREREREEGEGGEGGGGYTAWPNRMHFFLHTKPEFAPHKHFKQRRAQKHKEQMPNRLTFAAGN